MPVPTKSPRKFSNRTMALLKVEPKLTHATVRSAIFTRLPLAGGLADGIIFDRNERNIPITIDVQKRVTRKASGITPPYNDDIKMKKEQKTQYV